MNFWEKVRADLEKGFREGLHVMREGAAYVREKAEELTEEGKKRYRIFELKTKVQKEIAELGGKVYDLHNKGKEPMKDRGVKTTITRIKKLETQVTKLEKTPVKIAGKKQVKKRAK